MNREVTPKKISVIGYSGSGKSTLARRLGGLYSLPVLHLDTVNFLPNWTVRALDQCQEIVDSFMDQAGWIIDGNYSDLHYHRRLAESDEIVFLDFSRLTCFARAFRRYLHYKGSVRPDIAQGCPERFDLSFALWILKDGRSRERVGRFKQVVSDYPHKVVVLKNQKMLGSYLFQCQQSFPKEE